MKICKTCPNTTNVSFTVLHVCTEAYATLHCRSIKLARTSTGGGQIRVCFGDRDQGDYRGCAAWISSFFWKTRHGSEQVFVFGVAGKSYTYSLIANALRETWGNDERLRSQNSALSHQLQSGHLVGGVHWTGEKSEWQETDHDSDESMDPWAFERYDTEGFDDECCPEETDLTENFYEIDEYNNNDSTFSEQMHCWTNLSKHKKETRANWRPFKKR